MAPPGGAVTEQELQRALSALGIQRHNCKAVAVLPLVQVAWADGRIQHAERRVILAAAARYGLGPDTGEELVDQWLTRPPSPSYFLLARRVLLALAQRQQYELPTLSTLPQLVQLCETVAAAAGGLFGVFFTVERRERELIEEIAQSLSLGPSLPEEITESWRVPALDPDQQTEELPITSIKADMRAAATERMNRVDPNATTRILPRKIRGEPSDGTRTELIPDGIGDRRIPMNLHEDDEVTEPFLEALVDQPYVLEEE